MPEDAVRAEPRVVWPVVESAEPDLTQQASFAAAEPRAIYCCVKRTVDVVVALAAIVFCLPLWGLIAILIKLDSKGPVLFKQQRPGLKGQPFTLLKFRTMVCDAEDRLCEVMHMNLEGDGSLIRIKNDPRVTPLGRFLRGSSLDETPQFINVLLGHMSLVGPRPISRPITDWRNPIRLQVPPGLTGLWQISGRKDTGCAFMITKDLEYVCKRSLMYDLWIVLQTMYVVVRRSGGDLGPAVRSRPEGNRGYELMRILLLIGCIVLTAAGNLLLKSGMNCVGAVDGVGVSLMSYAAQTATRPQIILGFTFYVVSFAMWLALLSMMNISAVYPVFVSAAFVIVMAGSVIWFHEQVSFVRALGTGVVALGIYLISRG